MKLVSLSVRLYRVLLRLYPAPFRAEYADEMLRVFRDSCRAADQQSGASGVLRLWLPALGDLLLNAFAERAAGRSRRRIAAESLFMLLGLAGNVAAWFALWWSITFFVVLMLIPWETSAPPPGTLAQVVNDFLDSHDAFITMPGILTVCFSLLVFINAATRYRRYSLLSLPWRFALSTVLHAVVTCLLLGLPLLILRGIFPSLPPDYYDKRAGMASIYIGLVYLPLLMSVPLRLQTRLFYVSSAPRDPASAVTRPV